jgi:hypothetical protein
MPLDKPNKVSNDSISTPYTIINSDVAELGTTVATFYSGTTAQRPSVNVAIGDQFYNTQLKQLEIYTENGWVADSTGPQAPTNVTVSNAAIAYGGTPAAIVNWVNATAGSPAATYTVTSTPGSLTATGTSAPLTVSGLTAGTSYTFTVTATNTYGFAVSAASGALTAGTISQPPTAVTATQQTGTAASIAFTAPSNVGAAPITSYTVYANPSGQSVTGTSSPILFSGLASNTPHTFTMTAANSAGTSVFSTASAPITLTTSLFATDPNAQYLQLALPLSTNTGIGDFSATIKGSGTNKTMLAANGAAIDSTQSKFYGTSLNLTPYTSNRYVYTPNNSSMWLTNQDFTIEGWYYFDANNVGYQALASHSGDTRDQENGWIIIFENANTSINFYATNGSGWPIAIGGAIPSINAWHHVAVTRASNTTRLYVDGSLLGSTTAVVNIASPASREFRLGDYLWFGAVEKGLSGKVQDFRLYVGVAKYTGSTYILPTQMYGNQLSNTATATLTNPSGGTSSITLQSGFNQTLSTIGTWTITNVSSPISVNFIANGAGGGGGNYGGQAVSSVGGAGGRTTGTITLAPGNTYSLLVGQGGASMAPATNPGSRPIGGGGLAGTFGYGGQGGGYSGIFLGGVSQPNSLLIAGGGGGGATDDSIRPGGTGGGVNGGAGVAAAQAAGSGGTQTAAGTGISGTITGGPLLGGDCGGSGDGGGGGGGGGGYFGGGAGNGFNNGSSGGGGSGYINQSFVSGGTSTNGIGSAGGPDQTVGTNGNIVISK